MSDLDDNIDEDEIILAENKSYKGKQIKEWSYEEAGNWILDICTDMNIKLKINEKEVNPKEIFKQNEVDGKALSLFQESDFEKIGFKFGSSKKLFEALKILKGKLITSYKKGN